MKFGQYELLERVAVGGMAEVFRGRVVGAEGFEKWVAIKRILPEFAKDDRFISMMLTEARIHSALSHRNIVQIHDLGTSEDGEYFIVLEYVEGHDLRDVLEAAGALGVQVPDNLALHIADELAQALHFAHELHDPDGQPLGIIHRDVSPSNVLISNSGEVKLSDFGIAKRRREHSVVGSLKGNLVYMSPEQARRVPLDRRTDVFSLGAVLFEMLTGAKIREVSDEVNGFQQAASGVVRSATELRPDLPQPYAVILARALAANPNDRFPDAASFGAAIRELQRGSERPVGPTDIQELIEVLSPPRRARSPVELSRVIRLGPEFRLIPPPDKAPEKPSSAPATPSAASATPPAAPARPAASPLRAALAPRPRATTKNGMGAAPPPGNVPAPPPLAALPAVPGQTPPGPVRAIPPVPPRQTSPARPVSPTPPPMTVGLATERALSALHAVALTPPPIAPGGAHARRDPAPVSGPLSVAATPPLASPGHGPPRQAAAPEEGDLGRTPPPQSGAHPLAGWAAPPAVVPLAQSKVKAYRNGGWPARESLPAAAASGMELGHAADIRMKRGRGRPALVLALAGLVAAGVVVHLAVIPLPVLAVWSRPAELAVSSEPAGATVALDARTLPGLTPLRAEVKRDRAEHVLELTRVGSIPGRTTLRFDRTVPLEASVALSAEPPPPPPPTPVAPAVAPPPATEPPAVAATAPGDEAGARAGKHGKLHKGKKLRKGKKLKSARTKKAHRAKGKKRSAAAASDDPGVF